MTTGVANSEGRTQNRALTLSTLSMPFLGGTTVINLDTCSPIQCSAGFLNNAEYLVMIIAARLLAKTGYFVVILVPFLTPFSLRLSVCVYLYLSVLSLSLAQPVSVCLSVCLSVSLSLSLSLSHTHTHTHTQSRTTSHTHKLVACFLFGFENHSDSWSHLGDFDNGFICCWMTNKYAHFRGNLSTLFLGGGGGGVGGGDDK